MSASSARAFAARHWQRILFAVVAVGFLLYPLVTTNLYYQNMIIMSALLAIMASGWNIISGYAGYVSLGQSAFVGLGGYTVGILATRLDASPWWFIPAAAAR